MNIVKSILKYKCPRCRSANLFKTPFNISKPLDMPERCSNCQLNFEPEPGFYFGAMFISYGLSALLFLATALTLVLGFDWSPNQAMIVVVIIGLLVFFRILRLARAVWIHITVKFEGEQLSN